MTDQEAGFGRSGFINQHGLWSDDDRRRAEAVIAQVEADGIETIRINFVDQHGLMRGKAIPADALKSAFDAGLAMTSTLLLKDTSHKTVFPVWGEDAGFGNKVLTGASDVIMVPDPASFRRLPWSPHSAWMLSTLYLPDGQALSLDSRNILNSALARLHAHDLDLMTGLEVEFSVFDVIDPKLAHGDGGMPAKAPDTQVLHHGYQYLTEDRYDQIEDVMDDIRRGAQALDLPVRSMEVEFGPSQFEVTFTPRPGAAHAQTMVYFRAAVKQICRRAGLHATFMSRPQIENGMASGWHLHQSLIGHKDGQNRMTPDKGEVLSPVGLNWVAGLLDHAQASCLLSTPTVNGYKRYQAFALAPDRVQWGVDNKGAMIRAITATGDPASRIENRVGEPAANPYLYLASQVLSGLDGIDRALTPPAPSTSPYEGEAVALPRNLGAAIEAFSKSTFYREAFPAGFVDYLVTIKQAEWDRYLSTVSDWEQREYFSTF